MIYARSQAVQFLNELYQAKTPFVLFTDFYGHKAWIKPLDEIESSELKYSFPNMSTLKASEPVPDYTFNKYPVEFETYKKSFDSVVRQIRIGNSYLTNLTFKTPISTSLSLDQIFEQSTAPYRLKYEEKFVVFSPETFIRIEGDRIFTYPMKGTIDASIPNARAMILADQKEMAEHITIVDLIRNDISQIADQVEVSNFRFISELQTSDKELLQVSSEISGKLRNSDDLGTNLFQLLPAGSISGAPKKQTLEIIQNAESDERNFFTGVCGHFDGKTFESGVMIRFIEKSGDQFYFRSGGGITAFSDAKKEYQEMIDKVYVQLS